MITLVCHNRTKFLSDRHRPIFLTRLKEQPSYGDYIPNNFASYGYDTAWAIALMLNQSAETLRTNTSRSLEDFNL